MRTAFARVFVIAAVAIVMLTSAACETARPVSSGSSESTASPSNSSATSGAPPSTSRSTEAPSTTIADGATVTMAFSDAEILASTLRMLEQIPNWSYEPRGGITKDSTRSPFWGELIWAAVSGVSPDGSQITFDAVQFYKTGYGAEEEASKDAAAFISEDMAYVRNAYEHVQTLPLAPDATIVLDRSAVGDYPGVQSLGPDDLALVAITPQQFAHLFRDDPEFPTFSEGVGFWLVISDGVVAKIYDPYKS